MTLKHNRPCAEFYEESESAIIFAVQATSGEILAFFHLVPSRESAADDYDDSDVLPIMALPIWYQSVLLRADFPRIEPAVGHSS